MKGKEKRKAKVEKVMHEFKEKTLHSGSKKGPIVEAPKQAIAIMLSESKKQKKEITRCTKKLWQVRHSTS